MRVLIQIRVFLFILFCGFCSVLNAQSAVITPKFRWQQTTPAVQLPASSLHSDLPEADYTPAKSDINEWSAAKEIQSFSTAQAGKLSATFMLSVDETGTIRKVEIIKASNNRDAQKLSAIMLNTKLSGPSFSHNKAVAAYVPCEVSISNEQISII